MGMVTYPPNPFPPSSEKVGDAVEIEKDIAPFFNAETLYNVGEIVYYNGLLYRCTNAHEGAWDSDDFATTTISNEINSLMSGLTNLVKKVTETITTNSNAWVIFPEGRIVLSARIADYDELLITSDDILGFMAKWHAINNVGSNFSYEQLDANTQYTVTYYYI